MKNYCQEFITQEDRLIITKLDTLFVQLNHDQLKIYTKVPLHLTDTILLLNDFGLEIQESIHYALDGVEIYRFSLSSPPDPTYQHIATALIAQALQNRAPKRCRLYRLSLLEGFNLEHIHFLRAMIKYLDQLLIHKREESIIQTFLTHHQLVALLTQKFFAHSPQKERIAQAFEAIKSYEEDRLFKLFEKVIDSIVKTNFFEHKEVCSFKFDVAQFSHFLQDLEPKIEIFVYHPHFLGTHLRAAKISRGGIRWSDREDFRQEIKALMITQEAKNAIIVPAGAKGGIKTFQKVSKEEFRRYYTLYIEALLDLIDNEPAPHNDFYLVVAADKGTADMSDIANEIAQKRGYWLGDAFASGGSNGYSHKKLGVTAKGAWIAASHHFLPRKIDIFKDPITIVGIGSMRGDVFGNGLLLNPNAKLLAAISSKEIFIDPNPDPLIAYQERKRLFMEQKGWSEYDRSKISSGGGIFSRDEKSIRLSPQIRELFEIEEEFIDANRLVQKLLCAKVDLLYIGGVGTYVKSSDELNINIADKINENVRVDANALRSYAVCEGGNLGFTQKARIEYAKNGGKINLDHIDNSAGVHTSDYEVNIKIALRANQNSILQELTQEVLTKVFATNRAQPLAITLDELRSKEDKEPFIQAIELLEHHMDYFKRKDYAIPKNEDIQNIQSPTRALVRPVLGILLSYAKLFIKKLLLDSPLVDEPFFEHYLYKYFPKKMVAAFNKEIQEHPLRREIIATTAANIIIDNAGVTFISDYNDLGKERFLLKTRSYLLLYTLLSIAKAKEPLAKEADYSKILELEDSVQFALKWIIKNYHQINTEPFHILNYKTEIANFLNTQELFSLNDLIKFSMLAISLKELRDYRLSEVLELLAHIVKLFCIDKLLEIVYNFKPKDRIGKEMKAQLIELIDLFVTTIAKDVVLFTRTKESLPQGLQSYLEEKMIEPKRYHNLIKELDPQNLVQITSVVHKLLLEAV